jgi:YaiO family outer membrane protein
MIKYIAICLFVSLSLNLEAQNIFKNLEQEYYNQAVKETHLKNYPKAISLVKSSLEQRSNSSDAQILLVKLYILTNQNALALKLVKEILARDPKYIDAYYYAVDIELKMGNSNEALCFVDEGLFYYPDDKNLLLKKLIALDNGRKIYMGNDQAEYLLKNFPNDSTIEQAYINHHINTGLYYMSKKNSLMANSNFEKALLVDPDNKIANRYLLNVNNESNSNSTENNKSNLTDNVKSYAQLLKKADLLTDEYQYAEAISVLNYAAGKYPKSDAKKRAANLRLIAARFYANKDPYTLYEGIAENSPENREAINKLISINMTREQYNTALGYINRTLKNNPNEEFLLGNKVDILTYQKKYTQAGYIAQKLYNRNQNKYRQALLELKLASAKDFTSQQMLDSAINEYHTALSLDAQNLYAINNLSNIYLAQKNYPSALQMIDVGLAIYPNNDNLLLKKSSVLFDSGNINDALKISEKLVKENATTSKYLDLYIDQNMLAGRNNMNSEDFDEAIENFKNIINKQPANLEALNYLVNLESGTKNYNQELFYLDAALQINPDNKELLIKKSAALEDMKNFKAAYAISHNLMMRYPYKTAYKKSYTSQTVTSGRTYQKLNLPDSALLEYHKALIASPTDSLALLYTINTLKDKNLNDSTLKYINIGVKSHPNSEYFQLKRTEYLEYKKLYAEAVLAADSLVKINPSLANVDYAALLKSKACKNQFGLFYLNTTFDDKNLATFNIATLEYRHFLNKGKGAYAGRVNYAARNQGTGIQGELELYYNHTPKLYSYATAALSNQIIFPQILLRYSAFRMLSKTWEGEAGLRYFKSTNFTTTSLVLSAAKTYKDFWFNLRGFLVSDQNRNLYQVANFTGRHYMNNSQEFISFNAGVGNSPDDISTLIQFPSLQGVASGNVGVGYQKTFKYRTVLGINTNWINQKVTNTNYRNQYDLYFTFLRKF